MRIRILPFAVLRDALGESEYSVTAEPGATVGSLWSQLRSEHAALARFNAPPLFAVNEEYAAAGDELHDGDELALIPPVSGG